NATVQGLDSVPEDDQPPVGIVKLSFRAMVAIGSGLAALGAWFMWSWWRRGRLPRSPWFHRALVAAGPLSVVALIAGWVTTEVGRQPWVVYEVMRTEEAVTGAGGIPVGFASLGVVYAGLAVIAFVMLRRLGRKPFHAP
ncbi:MAG: cytochrome ubiquinol oxidase subunit I, partial [Pseudonocardiaceae bacterium]